MSNKFKAFCITAAVVVSVCLASCGDSVSQSRTDSISSSDMSAKVSQTSAETSQMSEENPQSEQVVYDEDDISQEDYCELSGEEYESFKTLQSYIDAFFTDISGKKVYGCRGMSYIETEDGGADCLIVDFYTYASKEYTKIATVAMPLENDDNGDIYFLENDGYVKASRNE